LLLLVEKALPELGLLLDAVDHLFLLEVLLLILNISLNLIVIEQVSDGLALLLAERQYISKSFETGGSDNLDLNVDQEKHQGLAPQLAQSSRRRLLAEDQVIQTIGGSHCHHIVVRNPQVAGQIRNERVVRIKLVHCWDLID